MTRERLSPRAHAVYELADGLLLVFKPAGHAEPAHSHPDAQRLRLLRGRLRVDAAGRSVVLDARSDELSIASGQEHATEALETTWLIAEASSVERE